MQTIFKVLEKVDNAYATYDSYATIGTTAGIHIIYSIIEEAQLSHAEKAVAIKENVEQKVEEKKERVEEVKEKQTENAKDLNEKSKKGFGSLKSLKDKGKNIKQDDIKDVKQQGEEVKEKVEEVVEEIEEIVDEAKQLIEDISHIPKKTLISKILEGLKTGVITGGIAFVYYKIVFPKLIKKIIGQETIEQTAKNSAIQLVVKESLKYLVLASAYGVHTLGMYIFAKGIEGAKPDKETTKYLIESANTNKQMKEDLSFQKWVNIEKLVLYTSHFLVLRYIPQHYHVISFELFDKIRLQYETKVNSVAKEAAVIAQQL